MKRSDRRLPITVGALGIAACLLRLSLYLLGTDEKGLLIPFHPLSIALWLLTAVTIALVVFRVFRLKNARRYAAAFPASNTAAIGCFTFAAGLLVTVLANRYTFSILEFLRNVLCLLAVPALTAIAICRRLGKRPLFGFHAVVCLALTLHTVSHYSGWSSCPQLIDAFFPMVGCIGLMLFAYYETAAEVGMGNRRMQLLTGLLAVFFCFAAIPGSDNRLMYLTGGIWALTNLHIPTLNIKEEVK